MNYKNLIAAVIGQAIKDYKYKSLKSDRDKLRIEAKKFLISEYCRYMCEVLEIDQIAILNKLGIIRDRNIERSTINVESY